jgi:hypothetical protein
MLPESDEGFYWGFRADLLAAPSFANIVILATRVQRSTQEL